MANEQQLMEYMYETYFKDTKGTYLDIGANDGIYHSTTSLLKDNGWVGYNVEANIHSYNELIKNRPNDNNFNLAISDTNGEIEFYYYESPSSGYKVGAATVVKDVKNNLTQHEWFTNKVKSITYCDFIKENNITELDFLNIDIEGHEMTVLNDMAKSNVLPRVICIEVVIIDKMSLNELLITSLGYHRDDNNISEGDWIYVKRED